MLLTQSLDTTVRRGTPVLMRTDILVFQPDGSNPEPLQAVINYIDYSTLKDAGITAIIIDAPTAHIVPFNRLRLWAGLYGMRLIRSGVNVPLDINDERRFSITRIENELHIRMSDDDSHRAYQ